ncbi:MAG: DUF433 domain-containing protein [Saprospiraceae bacterium]|nr:DUF433 domain-containing protein [Saprospiraceae bacterium]
MTALEKASAYLHTMSKSEIAQLVQRAASRLSMEFPGIEKTPGVCGGSVCIIRTRIPVWSIIEYMQLGVAAEKTVAKLPHPSGTGLGKRLGLLRCQQG